MVVAPFANRRLTALTLFGISCLALVGVIGVRTGADTALYWEGVEQLLKGEPLADRQPSYAGYIALLAVAKLLGMGNLAVVLAQVAMAVVAAGVVFRVTLEVGGVHAAALATALLALDVESNRWHAYVLSDSLYTSTFVVAVWLAYRAARRGAEPVPWLAAATAAAAAALIRPEGWFLIPAVCVYFVSAAVPAGRRRWVAIPVAVVCIATIGFIGPRLGGNVSAISPNGLLRAGQVIWSYDGWRLPMPQEPSVEGRGEASAAVDYALRHPLSTAALMTARVAAHLVHVRPFYSAAHNAFVLAWLIPVYAFASVGWWRTSARTLAWWCAVAFATQALVVAVGHADWDGRYLAHVLPLVYPFAAFGASRLTVRAGRRDLPEQVPAGPVAV